MSLTHDEINRYSTQLKLSEIGLEGQYKLKNARVLCVGAGGLGSSLLLYLAAAGVGTIGIIDDDTVEISNLSRQVLYHTSQLGQKKVLMAKKQLLSINPHLICNVYTEKLAIINAKKLMTNYDIIADCSDNFTARYIINDTCFYLNKPWVFASVLQYKGQCSIFLAEKTACFRCLFPFIPKENSIPNCGQSGLLGVLPGLLGIIQATKILKWLLTIGEPLFNRLLMIDILTGRYQEIYLAKDPNCKLCVLRQPMELLSGQEDLIDNCAICAKDVQFKLDTKENIILIDVRSLEEHCKYNLGGLLIPLAQLPDRLIELNPENFFIIYCETGVRSQQAVKILIEKKFKFVKFLSGGILAWQKNKR